MTPDLLKLPDRSRPDMVSVVTEVPASGKARLLELEGPGSIVRLWMVLPPGEWRDLIVRAYWDGETLPSIESPLGDLFGLGHGRCNGAFSSQHLVVVPNHGLNLYFPMPFAKSAILEVENDGPQRVKGFYFQADCRCYDQPVDTPYRFHAKWRREAPALRRATPYTILEACGEGYVAGLTYHVHKVDDDHRWTHGGGGAYFLDGETAPHFIHIAGGEDFFGGAWGSVEFQAPFIGCHLADPPPTIMKPKHGWSQPEGGRWSQYRWFDPDPVTFQSSVRFVFGANANNISSVAYWYQTEPHVEFFRLPQRELRLEGSAITHGSHDLLLRLSDEIPLAVLGPVVPGDGCPWSPTGALDLAQVYETNHRGPYQAIVEGAQRPIRWQRTETRLHFLDWNAIHRPKVRMRHLWPDQPNPSHTSGIDIPAGSYALARAQMQSPTDAVLRVGSDNLIVVWLNGNKVFRNHRPSPHRFAEDAIPLRLQAGVNDLVVFNTTERRGEWGGWAISFRLTDGAGQPLPEMQWDNWSELPPTLEHAAL